MFRWTRNVHATSSENAKNVISKQAILTSFVLGIFEYPFIGSAATTADAIFQRSGLNRVHLGYLCGIQDFNPFNTDS